MFTDLVKKTRSYRNFDRSVPITREALVGLIELCRFTPSTANRQALKFAIAFKAEDCSRIFPLLGFAGYLKEKNLPYEGNEPMAYIMICYDTDIMASPELDAGICAQTIVLAAAEKGIGACMVGSFPKDKLAEMFELKGSIVPRLIIALGAPNEKIELTDAVGGDIKYYRDKNDTHFVPKRPLAEILLPEIK